MNPLTVAAFLAYMFLVVVYDKFRHEIYRNILLLALIGFAIYLVI